MIQVERKKIIMLKIIGARAVMIILCFSVGAAEMPSKILGGSTVSIEEFPHQVSVRIRNRHACSGSIITTMHILTTASCVLIEIDGFEANIKILSGTNDQMDALQTENINDVHFIIFHEDYDPTNYWIHDIAILTIDVPLVFSPERQPILLPSSPNRYNEIAYVIGWGGTSIRNPEQIRNLEEIRNPDRYLQKIGVKLTYRKSCETIFSKYRFLRSNQICAKGHSTSAFDKGDSGSPLIVRGKIYGIASIADQNYLSFLVYTDVYPYLNWINNVIATD